MGLVQWFLPFWCCYFIQFKILNFTKKNWLIELKYVYLVNATILSTGWKHSIIIQNTVVLSKKVPATFSSRIQACKIKGTYLNIFFLGSTILLLILLFFLASCIIRTLWRPNRKCFLIPTSCLKMELSLWEEDHSLMTDPILHTDWVRVVLTGSLSRLCVHYHSMTLQNYFTLYTKRPCNFQICGIICNALLSSSRKLMALKI